MLLFGDPYSFPMDEYLKRLNANFPGVPAVGGMASGGMGPGQNLLISKDGIEAQGAHGVALEGAIDLRLVVSQGCRPIGRPWVVTACEEHLIGKLGGRPALDVLMETLTTVSAPEEQKLFQRGPFVGLAIDSAKSQFNARRFPRAQRARAVARRACDRGQRTSRARADGAVPRARRGERDRGPDAADGERRDG